jgi:hypothetical protein
MTPSGTSRFSSITEQCPASKDCLRRRFQGSGWEWLLTDAQLAHEPAAVLDLSRVGEVLTNHRGASGRNPTK